MGVLFPDPKPDDTVVTRKHPITGNVENLTVVGRLAPDVITQQEFEKFNSGEIFFVVYARIEYAEPSGIRHWTQACGYLAGPNQTSTAGKCVEYNAVDANNR
jgi:pyruvoyl-dependent arginine decarboxylase (PvlArgDC)